MRHTNLKMALSVLTLTPALWAAEYYVAPGGSDSNSGAVNAPFATIQHAANITSPGDTVIVEDGIYSSQAASGTGSALVNISRSGAPNAYITFRSQHKWGAVLEGLNNHTAEGWAVGGSYIRVQDFEIRGFSDDALSNVRGGQFIQVVGNSIHQIGRYCTDIPIGRDGLYLAQPNVSLERNLLYDIGRYSDGESGCRPSTMTYQNNDHGIYIAGANNVLVVNNVFYNITHGWSVHIYSKPVDNIAILNNTFASANPWYPGQIIVAEPITNSRIENNLFYSQRAAAIYFDPSSLQFPAADSVTIRNNLSTGAMTQLNVPPAALISDFLAPGIVYAANREAADPKLTNPSIHEFTLANGSPAIHAGIALPEVTIDNLGNPRPNPPSIGAFEITQ